MAFIVPVAAAIGGGSAATGAVLLAGAAATVAGGVMSAQASRRAGKFTQAQAEIDARAEGDAAREREIERKRGLMRALSSQAAQAGRAGVSFTEGAPAHIARLDIDEANRDLITDTANTRQRQSGLRAQGRAARFQGRAQAAATLLDTVGRTTSAVLR